MPDHLFECMVCQSHDADVVYKDCKDYYLGVPHRVDYHKCRSCGLVQQSPLPGDTAAFYLEYPIHTKKSRWSTILRRALMDGSYYPATRTEVTRKLLDIGCGDGWFLESCKDKNYDLQGFELDSVHASNVSRLIGVPVTSDLDGLKQEQAKSFDIVTMNFVVEHLTDLGKIFNDVHALLKPSGEFYFSVPNLDSYEARIFGRKWHGLDPPRHICFPSESIVRLLAGRHGFEVHQSRNLPFPPGFAGSVPVTLTGKFRYPLFLLAMPIALALNYLHPESARSYSLRKVTIDIDAQAQPATLHSLA